MDIIDLKMKRNNLLSNNISYNYKITRVFKTNSEVSS